MGAWGAVGFGGGGAAVCERDTYPRVCGNTAAHAASRLETHSELEWWPVVTGTGRGQEAGLDELGGTEQDASTRIAGELRLRLGWPATGPEQTRVARPLVAAAVSETGCPWGGCGLGGPGCDSWEQTQVLATCRRTFWQGISASVQKEGSQWTPLRSLLA